MIPFTTFHMNTIYTIMLIRYAIPAELDAQIDQSTVEYCLLLPLVLR